MKKKYLGKTVGSLLIVLLLMPLGHALMILMEHFLEPTTLHYSAFLMGFVGLVITIAGVFVKGDTRQTCFGLAGAKDSYVHVLQFANVFHYLVLSQFGRLVLRTVTAHYTSNLKVVGSLKRLNRIMSDVAVSNYGCSNLFHVFHFNIKNYMECLARMKPQITRHLLLMGAKL